MLLLTIRTIGIVAVVALSISAADARTHSRHPSHFGGAYASYKSDLGNRGSAYSDFQLQGR